MSPSDGEELLHIDAAIARITSAVPEYPYLLSTGTAAEPRYHYPTHQEAESWARNTPFRQSEERLQYMTYVYREPGETCFVVRSHIDEERDRLAAQALKKKKVAGGVAIGAGTPVQGTANRTKISLSAYRSQKAAGTLALKSPEKKVKDLENGGKRDIVEMEGKKKINGAVKGIKIDTPKREEKPVSSLKRYVKCARA